MIMKFHQYISIMLFILIIIVLQDFQKQLFQQVLNTEKFNFIVSIASITGDMQEKTCSQRKLPSLEAVEGKEKFNTKAGNFHHEEHLKLQIIRKPVLPPNPVEWSRESPRSQAHQNS